MQKQKLTFATFKELTRLELSFFGLPFIIGGALLPFASFQFCAHFSGLQFLKFLWLVPAFMAARLSGMAFNQLIDANIDAKNERTKGRPIPSGRASLNQAGMIAWSCLFAFILICAFINKVCFSLSFLAALLIVFYSYMKRINMACHFVLGAIHLLAPVMAAALISGTFSKPAFFLGLMAFFSIAGNDIAYAIQDTNFDIKQKLHSIPAKLGIEKALWIARACHLVALWAYMKMASAASFPQSSILCIFILGYLYFQFHRQLLTCLKKNEVGKISKLFMRCNIIVPSLTLAFILLGVVWSSA